MPSVDFDSRIARGGGGGDSGGGGGDSGDGGLLQIQPLKILHYSKDKSAADANTQQQ
jgi:hypothetical protein